MLVLTLKYRKLISLLVLTSYLLISILTLFHYHPYEFNQLEVVKKQNSFDSNSQLASGYGSACIVYQNFNSLHSIHFSHTLTLLSDLVYKEVILPNNENSFPPFNIYSFTKLRAPPISS